MKKIDYNPGQQKYQTKLNKIRKLYLLLQQFLGTSSETSFLKGRLGTRLRTQQVLRFYEYLLISLRS